MGRGTEATRAYYETAGWARSREGVLSDNRLWGTRLRGPIRERSHQLRRRRVRDALRAAGEPIDLLECGCGGNPAVDLLEVARHYTAVDFSRQGLAEAQQLLAREGTPFRLVQGDMCRLPFPDASFDAVYSANALYHVVDPEAQAAAMRELLRVTRPGGVVVLVHANPRALLFPMHTLRRIIADVPVLGSLFHRLRPPPPIPYNPRPLRWMRRRLSRHGRVDITGYTMPSVWFNKTVCEREGLGRHAWRAIAWLERERPRLAARLGCFVQVTVRRDHGSR